MLKVRKKKGWGMKKEISVGKIGRMYEFGQVHKVNEKKRCKSMGHVNKKVKEH